MNIFEKRPLALILCIGLSGFFLFTFDNAFLRICLCIIGILPIVLSSILKFDNYKKILFRISGGVLLFSLLLSFLYFDLWFKAYEIYDDEVAVVGVVEDSSATNSYTTRLKVKVKTIDGENKSGYTFYAYTSKADTVGIIEGTTVSFNATLTGFSDESIFTNFAKGINAYASDVKNLTIISYSEGSLEETLSYIKEYLSRYTIMLSDRDTGAMLSALLLGERDYLPDQLRLDFKRIGISHILALSGMHLAILSAGLGWMLTRLNIRKKTRIIITNIFVLIYMAITGFSVSVVRAGLMLIISSSLFLFSRSRDVVTSLFVAVSLICLINPHSIFDISLLLSAGATFGIIALSEYVLTLPKDKTRTKKIVKVILLSLLTSVFAISATIGISASTFGGMSIIAPFATLIFSVIVEIIMYLGCVMILIGWLIPIGAILSPLCAFVSWLAGAISSLEYVYVSSTYEITSVTIIVYSIAFYLFIILKIKRRKEVLAILLVIFSIIMILPTVLSIYEDSIETVAYRANTKADNILVRSKNEVCLINSSQYSQSTAYTVLNLLEDGKVTYLDKYLLTHYSWSIDEELDILLSNILVEKIYLPRPRNEDEETILKILYQMTEDYRTEIVEYSVGETINVGKYSLNLIYSSPYGETSMNAFCFTDGVMNYSYISSGLMEGKTLKTMEGYVRMSDYVIFGEHGKKYKTAIKLEGLCDRLDHMIIHSSNLFLTQKNMAKYQDMNAIIEMHPIDTVYLK